MLEVLYAHPFSWQAAGVGEAWSALPDAPQVIEDEHATALAPARARTARLLYRLAVMLEPAHSSAA